MAPFGVVATFATCARGRGRDEGGAGPRPPSTESLEPSSPDRRGRGLQRADPGRGTDALGRAVDAPPPRLLLRELRRRPPEDRGRGALALARAEGAPDGPPGDLPGARGSDSSRLPRPSRPSRPSRLPRSTTTSRSSSSSSSSSSPPPPPLLPPPLLLLRTLPADDDVRLMPLGRAPLPPRAPPPPLACRPPHVAPPLALPRRSATLRRCTEGRLASEALPPAASSSDRPSGLRPGAAQQTTTQGLLAPSPLPPSSSASRPHAPLAAAFPATLLALSPRCSAGSSRGKSSATDHASARSALSPAPFFPDDDDDDVDGKPSPGELGSPLTSASAAAARTSPDSATSRLRWPARTASSGTKQQSTAASMMGLTA